MAHNYVTVFINGRTLSEDQFLTHATFTSLHMKIEV